MNIYLVRHAPTVSTRHDVYVGVTDDPLSTQGEKEASLIASVFEDRKIDAVLCSNLKRSKNTAQAIAEICKAPLIEDSELREINFGSLEGKDFHYMNKHFPLLVECWKKSVFKLSFPEGDNFSIFAGRVKRFADKLIRQSYENVIVVGHGGFLKLLTCYLMNMERRHWWKFKYATSSISHLVVIDDVASILTFNDTSHLRIKER